MCAQCPFLCWYDDVITRNVSYQTRNTGVT